MSVKFLKERLMRLAGISEDVAPPGGGDNAFRYPGHMAMVNQTQEVERVLNGDEDTVPSDEPEEFEYELLSLDFD